MTADGPPITFAVPYYSGPKLLTRAIASVFRQTRPDWRLLVCDDSPDGSAAAVVNPFADTRVTYSRNPVNLGMAGNWNRCLDAADTPLVTLLHGDDELLPNYAAVMTAAAAAHPTAAALFCRATVVGPAGDPVFSVPDRVKDVLAPTRRLIRLAGPGGVARLLRGNFVMCPTVCYRRAALGGVRFDARWKFVLDLDLFTRLLAGGREMVGVPDVAYAYRRHPENATAQYTESLLRFREEAALYDELAAAADPGSPVRRVGRGKRIIKLHLLFRVLEDAARGRAGAARRKLSYLADLTLTPPGGRSVPCET
jgi:glycosyltransferase involved in cell wall biosynthesis